MPNSSSTSGFFSTVLGAGSKRLTSVSSSNSSLGAGTLTSFRGSSFGFDGYFSFTT